MRVVTTATMSRRARMPRRPASELNTATGFSSDAHGDFGHNAAMAMCNAVAATKPIPPRHGDRNGSDAMAMAASTLPMAAWPMPPATTALTWPAATAPMRVVHGNRNVAAGATTKASGNNSSNLVTATAPMPAATRVRISRVAADPMPAAMQFQHRQWVDWPMPVATAVQPVSGDSANASGMAVPTRPMAAWPMPAVIAAQRRRR